MDESESKSQKESERQSQSESEDEVRERVRRMNDSDEDARTPHQQACHHLVSQRRLPNRRRSASIMGHLPNRRRSVPALGVHKSSRSSELPDNSKAKDLRLTACTTL